MHWSQDARHRVLSQSNTYLPEPAQIRCKFKHWGDVFTAELISPQQAALSLLANSNEVQPYPMGTLIQTDLSHTGGATWSPSESVRFQGHRYEMSLRQIVQRRTGYVTIWPLKAMKTRRWLGSVSALRCSAEFTAHRNEHQSPGAHHTHPCKSPEPQHVQLWLWQSTPQRQKQRKDKWLPGSSLSLHIQQLPHYPDPPLPRDFLGVEISPP